MKVSYDRDELPWKSLVGRQRVPEILLEFSFLLFASIDKAQSFSRFQLTHNLGNRQLIGTCTIRHDLWSKNRENPFRNDLSVIDLKQLCFAIYAILCLYCHSGSTESWYLKTHCALTSILIKKHTDTYLLHLFIQFSLFCHFGLTLSWFMKCQPAEKEKSHVYNLRLIFSAGWHTLDWLYGSSSVQRLTTF